MSTTPTFAAENPFLASVALRERQPFDAVDADVVSATAPEGSYAYAMVASTPAVSAEEVESTSRAIEITVRWGSSLLKIEHLAPARSFTVGEEGCDFTMAAEKLGARAVSLVSVDVDGTVCVRDPNGEMKRLDADGRTKVVLGELEFEVANVRAARRIATRQAVNKRAFGFGAIAAVLHAGLFAAMYTFTPTLDTTDDSGMTADQQARYSEMVAALAEREPDQATDQQRSPDDASNAGNDGQRARDKEGTAGSSTAPRTNAAFAVKKTSSEMMALNRDDAIKDAQAFGMIGILASSEGGDSDALHSPWGTVANGSDPLNRTGNMWADSLGNSFGEDGLGLSGAGKGGGGYADLIGLGDIGTIGHNHGTCEGGACSGIGTSNGIIPGAHHPMAHAPRAVDTHVSGRLPPDVIQRVIRQNFGRFRACYESGLRSNPTLQGRVGVSFVIGADGSVGSVSGGGDLPDQGVISCVSRAFGALSFPAPDGGIVTVSYPISFSPTN